MARPLNLGQIKARVQHELAYAPDVKDWRADVREVIQGCYDDLTRNRRVPWLYRTAPLWVFPDFEVTTLLWSGSPHSLELVETELTGDNKLYVSNDSSNLLHAAEAFQLFLTGAELDLADTSKRAIASNQGNGVNWEMAPFVIEFVIPDSGTVYISLDPRAEFLEEPDSDIDGNYKLSFPRTLLPVDCDQVLQISTEEGVVLQALSPAAQRTILPSLTAGPPRYLLEDGGHAPRLPPVIYPGVTHNVSGVYPAQHADLYQVEAPQVQGTLAATATLGGTLAASTDFTVFCCWFRTGMFGPPSNEVEVSTTAANKTISLTGLPVASALDIGRKVAIFVRQEEGPFYLAGFQLVPTTSTFTLAAFPTATVNEAQRATRWDEVFNPSPMRWVRMLPRTDKPRRLELQYQKHARQLIADTDMPEFEAAYHELLVFMATARIAQRDSPELARTMQIEYRRVQRAYDSFYTPSARYTAQKGMIGAPLEPWVGFLDPAKIQYVP